ncbi:DUF4373 domain-containing protein [Aminipila terrae]|uniref:DUF4373 domain-containing protein n=1 Tax=Aminipila terrae TaxID=2697030 RepID=A0A6P1MGI1_9FIRM|nr:DUF4373 domain-containing protein [Aminipila terrae]QHI73800.1 DUF4373 domain-containing protein [Aminipila terrae]
MGSLQDKKVKLIRGEFGAKGVLVLLNLWCACYGENGYYKEWDNDDCILMVDTVACGCTPSFIDEVVKGCIRRSIFDEGVFNAFGILTSRGIQRRYLRAVSNRDSIEMIAEYWLLDINNPKDVPASISKKLTFKNITLQNNLISLQNNPVNLQRNYTKERKGKESKEKESEESLTIPHSTLLGSFANVELSETELNELSVTFENYNDLINKVSEYLKNATRLYQSHYALICKIAREDKWPKKRKVVGEIESKPIESVPMPEELKKKMGLYYKSLEVEK